MQLAFYKDRKECGISHLFLKKSFMGTALRSWTNNHLNDDGKKEVSERKYLAYIGLEMAMSIAQFNTIDEYWKRDMFLGHTDFQRVMSRDDFQIIRLLIKFVPPSMPNDGEVGALDPLRHSRKLLEHFQSNCVSVAVPTGCSALDENTGQTKARMKEQSYVKGKPDPYGVQFYAGVGSMNKYLFTFWDNGLGNWT